LFPIKSFIVRFRGGKGTLLKGKKATKMRGLTSGGLGALGETKKGGGGEKIH